MRISLFSTGLALLALGTVAACTSTPMDSNSPPPSHDVGIIQNAASAGPNAFSPSNLVMSLATTTKVVWYNGDFTSSSYGTNGTAHRLASDDGTTFTSTNIAPEGTFQATFTAPGTYTYHCQIHSTMTGTVTVNP